MGRVLRWTNCCLVFLIASCVTVNVYFPAAEVQKAADKIVEDVHGKEGAPASKPGPSSWLGHRLKELSLWPSVAYAQVNINVSTPAIRATEDAMKRRYPQLKPYFDKGAIGENNNGLLDIRDAAALNLQERGQATALVQEENNSRMTLYRDIATANKLGPEAVPQIQKIFANSWRNQSQAGWWIQNNAGAWEKKK
jgi:uncharacterized protein YdbL (DUF1318 family)